MNTTTLQFLIGAIKQYKDSVSPNTVVTAGDLLAIVEEASNEEYREANSKLDTMYRDNNKSHMDDEHGEDYSQPPIHIEALDSYETEQLISTHSTR